MRRFVPVAAAVSLVAGLRVAHDAGVQLPGCPFRALTGVDCPGCGSTRALLSLSRGDVLESLDFNALVVPALAVLVVSLVVSGFSGPRRPLLAGRWSSAVVGSTIAVFWVLRLLPGPLGALLASAPR